MTDFSDVPLQYIEIEDSMSLFTLLENRDEETFCQRCAENSGRLDENNGNYTYLQLACFYGLPKAVEGLLMNGADPNLICRPDDCPPIMIAGEQGYLNIVEILFRNYKVDCKSTAEGTILHALLKGMSKARDRGDLSSVIEKYENCIKLILMEEQGLCVTLDINAQNKDGFTALHLAVTLQEKNIILMLLEHGAYIGLKCRQGYSPISLMNADLFEEYLNNCVDTNGKLPIDKDYKIIYDYRFLVPPRISCNEPEFSPGNHALVLETEPLIEISCVLELRHLLKHPVLASFLHMKWFTVRKSFWINSIFYLTFWFFLTLNTLDRYIYSEIFNNIYIPDSLHIPTSLLPIVLYGLIGLREYLKFFISPIQYVSDVKNLLVVALLISHLFILFGNVNAGVAAIILLLTWAEMVLLIHHHPLLSSNIEMYKKVSTSFLKLLVCWSMLLVAFAQSFYLLFTSSQYQRTGKYNCTQNHEGVSKFFENTLSLFFKVIIMMTGEFETSLIPFDCYPGYSHAIFLLFVFMVSIVLFNLMNGLAVSDTQAIRNDAEIVGYATLAKQIVSIEKTIKLSSRVNLFPSEHKLHDLTACVFPNWGNQVVLSNSANQEGVPGRWETPRSRDMFLPYNGYWSITSGIVNETKKILQERKRKREEDEHSSNSLNRYSEKQEEYGRRLTLLEETTNEKLNRVIELLGRRN